MSYYSNRHIGALLTSINQGVASMAIDLSAFQAELARNTSQTASVKTLLDTLANQVTSLTTQLSQAGVDPATLSALTDMQAMLKANDDTTAAALATDGGGATPAPAPAPAPAPTPAPAPAPAPAPDPAPSPAPAPAAPSSP
jgi:hypothetical protein